MRSLKLVAKVVIGVVGLCLLWWLAKRQQDPIGEMVVDQDMIDDHDDPGVDVDDEV